jgi:hypothetical protein
MGHGVSRRYGWALSLAAALTLTAAAATPCGNDVRPIQDPKVATVLLARDALAAGKFQLAAHLVRTVFPAVDTASPGDNPASIKGLRIIALAAVRSLGAVTPAGEGAASPAQRADSLAWAVRALRSIDAERKNDAWRRSDLGEALAKIEASRAEAREILEDLAAKDVLATAEGYAALAGLRAERGDGAGREDALARCKRMTLTPAICKAPAPARPGT